MKKAGCFGHAGPEQVVEGQQEEPCNKYAHSTKTVCEGCGGAGNNASKECLQGVWWYR